MNKNFLLIFCASAAIALLIVLAGLVIAVTATFGKNKGSVTQELQTPRTFTDMPPSQPTGGKLPIRKPKALSAGDTIGIIAPASGTDPENVEPDIVGVKSLGYKVKAAPNLASKYGGYLAGNTSYRAELFMEFWNDPEVKALWAVTGGYGTAQILPYLDFKLMRENPKIFLGMSDITALHNALTHTAGLVTYYGPVVTTVFALKTITERQRKYCINSIEKVLSSNNTFNESMVYEYPKVWNYGPIKTLVGGNATGRLTGGTLSIVVSLIGTPWQIDTRDKIVVLEDVGEWTYRMDRMFNQMKQTGMLTNCAGVILSHCANCDPKYKGDFTIYDVYENYFANANYPVLVGFPAGHLRDQVTLPLNCLARLDATNHQLELLENCVER